MKLFLLILEFVDKIKKKMIRKKESGNKYIIYMLLYIFVIKRELRKRKRRKRERSFRCFFF